MGASRMEPCGYLLSYSPHHDLSTGIYSKMRARSAFEVFREIISSACFTWQFPKMTEESFTLAEWVWRDVLQHQHGYYACESSLDLHWQEFETLCLMVYSMAAAPGNDIESNWETLLLNPHHQQRTRRSVELPSWRLLLRNSVMQRFLLQTSQNEHSLRSGVASDWRKHVLIHRRIFLVEQFARFLTSSLSCTAVANLFTEDGDGVYQSNIRLEDLTAVGEKIPPDVVLFVYQWYSWDQLLRYFWSSHEGQRCLRRLLREKRGLRISALKEIPVTQAMLRRKDRKILLDIFCYFELPLVLSGGHLDRWLDYLLMSGLVRGKKNRLRMELELVRNTSLHRLQVLNELTQRRP